MITSTEDQRSELLLQLSDARNTVRKAVESLDDSLFLYVVKHRSRYIVLIMVLVQQT